MTEQEQDLDKTENGQPQEPKPTSSGPSRQYGIVELLAAVGDDQIAFQLLSECVTNVQERKRGLTALTFLTDAVNVHDVAFNEGRIGFVVWLPREAFTAARAKCRAPTSDAGSVVLVVDPSRSIPNE